MKEEGKKNAQQFAKKLKEIMIKNANEKFEENRLKELKELKETSKQNKDIKIEDPQNTKVQYKDIKENTQDVIQNENSDKSNDDNKTKNRAFAKTADNALVELKPKNEIQQYDLESKNKKELYRLELIKQKQFDEFDGMLQKELIKVLPNNLVKNNDLSRLDNNSSVVTKGVSNSPYQSSHDSSH